MVNFRFLIFTLTLSCYQRYIPSFSDMATSLNSLMQKSTTFMWTRECSEAFTTLKSHFVQAPILMIVHSCFRLMPVLSVFVFLDQDRHVVAYASQTLNPSKINGSMIYDSKRIPCSCLYLCTLNNFVIICSDTIFRS